MLSPKKLYKNKDGQTVVVYAINRGGPYSVHGAFFDKGLGYWVPGQWTTKGRWSVFDFSHLDIALDNKNEEH